jgi:hypothetical protein
LLQYEILAEVRIGSFSKFEAREVGFTPVNGHRQLVLSGPLVAGTVTLYKSLSRYKLCPQEFKDEKASLFGLLRDCWDNNPTFHRICTN